MKPAWLLLFGRMALFIIIQSLFALGFWLLGSLTAWDDGATWWPMVVFISNIVCIAVLITLFRKEAKNYWHLFHIQKQTWLSDILILLASFLVIGPVSILPNIWLGQLLFENPQTTLDLMIRPLPFWATYAALILFPITQGLAELPVYFGYVMPRLNSRAFPNLLPIVLPAIMLGVQHAALPFLFNVPFLLWRGLMFIPFAFAVGFMLHWRPRLLPYFAVIHALMDLSFAMYFLPLAY
jgi:hypothetical protein